MTTPWGSGENGFPRRFAPRNDRFVFEVRWFSRGSLSSCGNPHPLAHWLMRIMPMEKRFYVYILSSQTNVTIYTGVTSNLPARIWEHKNHLDPNSFTAKYDVTKLVYFEEAGTEPIAAFEREKQIKSWSRARKNRLIESVNPAWVDLYSTLLE